MVVKLHYLFIIKICRLSHILVSASIPSSALTSSPMSTTDNLGNSSTLVVIMSAPLVLLGFYLWDYIERQISKQNAERYRPYPLPAPEDRRHDVSDVSVIVPTIDADANFPGFLCRWLSNRPHEVILVTVESEETALRELIETPEVKAAMTESNARVKLLTVKRANKRDQLCAGINASTGKIIALVDDDAYFKSNDILLQLLSPFQEDDVGLVGGPISSYVPKDRQHSNVITPWEVAAIRIRQKRGRNMAAAFMADGGTNFTVSGLTMLLRGEILRDPVFQRRFRNDLWMGQRQNTGDDAFITRWVLYHHHLACAGEPSESSPKRWRLGMQLVPEAEVSTSVMRDSRFAGQMRRWYRTGLRHRLTSLIYEPGLFRMYSTTPYMTRKMIEGLFNPIFTIIRALLWWKTLRMFPLLAMILLYLELHRWGTSLLGFVEEYEFCRSKIWVAIIVDKLSWVSDWFSWATLGTEAWMTRSNVDNDV